MRNEESCKTFVEKVIQHFGQVDVLVNNAAGNFMTSAENLSSNGFKTVLEIDTLGSFTMCKAVLPYMKKNGGGLIVNISATLQ